MIALIASVGIGFIWGAKAFGISLLITAGLMLTHAAIRD